jgi:hypothetical protein
MRQVRPLSLLFRSFHPMPRKLSFPNLQAYCVVVWKRKHEIPECNVNILDTAEYTAAEVPGSEPGFHIICPGHQCHISRRYREE